MATIAKLLHRAHRDLRGPRGLRDLRLGVLATGCSDNQQPQQQHTNQPEHRDDRFQDRPCGNGFGHGHPEVSLTSQKPPSLT